MASLENNSNPDVVQPFIEEMKKDPKSNSVIEVSTPYSRKKQLLATLCATTGCLLNGGAIGYTGPANPSLMHPNGTDIYGNPFSLTFQQISWITSLVGLGAFFGALTSGFLMERLGRKKFLMLVTSGAYFVGCALIFFANHASMIYIGRFLIGMGFGFDLCGTTVYIMEIATVDMRGLLGCFVQLMGCVGLLFTFVIGAFLDWKFLILANSIWSPLFTLCMFVAPESPRWLILKGREYSAMRSLEFLRGKDNRDAVEKEIEIIKRDIALGQRHRVSSSQLLQHWRPFLVSVCMMFVFNLSGFNVLVFYTINIFLFARSNIHTSLILVLVAVTLLVSCICAIIAVAKFNRKSILLISILAMTLCQFLLGYSMSHSEYVMEQVHAKVDAVLSGNLEKFGDLEIPFNATRQDLVVLFAGLAEFPSFLGWMPVLAVIGFIFMGNAGYGTLIWVVTAEMLPPRVRSAANSICICFGFVSGFLVAKTFVDLIEAIENSGTFYLYSAFCLLGFVFTAIFVPETKGKGQEEIQTELNRNVFQCFADAFCFCCRKR